MTTAQLIEHYCFGCHMTQFFRFVRRHQGTRIWRVYVCGNCGHELFLPLR